ncbi:hypothetical protein NC651_004232 [Populus alba x Populus x berolinensis]|nr:hypothetical protein NC651_004232 [Populus alba x Populus x berolinensis]
MYKSTHLAKKETNERLEEMGIGILKIREMRIQDTPWYGGLARNVLALDMVVFHDQFSKDSSLRSNSGWKLGRKLRFFY